MKNKKLESLYQDRLPKEIERELTPEIRRQYFLWDEIMKREIELYPWLVLPVVKEIFHKEYPDNRNIVLLSTEYTVSRVHEKGEKLIHAIRSDILIKIESDLYHFECQIEKDGKMVFRMLEYDVHIALTHGKAMRKGRNQPGEFAVSFPKSAVLYLGDSENVPEYETCTLHFQDGTSHIYRVPVLKVQSYSPAKIEERHLNILIPFLVIRFRERIKAVLEKDKERILLGKEIRLEEEIAIREEVKRDITEFLSECMIVLQHERERGILPENASKDIGEFLWKTCGYLLEEDTELYEEVNAGVEPAIKLSREIIQELKDSNKELQDSYKELQDNNKELQNDIRGLQDNNKELHRELENVGRRLIAQAESEGKSADEIEDMLMKIFSLTKADAREKIKTYRREKQNVDKTISWLDKFQS